MFPNSSLPINFPKKFITSTIDEFPLLFIITSLIKGTSKFYDIGELRNKESDRIKCMERGLNEFRKDLRVFDC